jgi:hypothetical protein
MNEQMAKGSERSRHAQLQTLRDEIRVKVHLAEMEAKDRWKRLEPEVERLLGKLETATERTVDRMMDKLRKLNDSLSH